MTPQMGGNLAFHRRQPVRPCPDETVNSERFGVCIRKTCYRTEQEDRVSESVSKLKELSLKKIAASIFMKAVNVAMNRKDKVHINGLIAVSRIQFGQWNIGIKLYTMLWRSDWNIPKPFHMLMLRTHIGSFLKTIYASSGLLSHVFSLPIDSNHNLRVLV